MLRFGEPLAAVTWSELDAVDRRRAALFWRFNGGAAEYPSIDALLMDTDTARYDVRDEGGRCVARWWQFYDAGLLFAASDATILGEAIQHGFVARDRNLWAELAAAVDTPGHIAWEVGDNARPLWSAPPDADALVREIDALPPVATTPPVPPVPARRTPARPARAKRSSLAAGGDSRAEYTPGDAVRILYGASWYDGRVTAREEKGYRITYDGWGPEWDETVGADRLQRIPRPVGEPVAERYQVGDRVLIKWNNAWYEGRVNTVQADGYGISYDGWASNWDEVVPASRLATLASRGTGRARGGRKPRAGARTGGRRGASRAGSKARAKKAARAGRATTKPKVRARGTPEATATPRASAKRRSSAKPVTAKKSRVTAKPKPRTKPKPGTKQKPRATAKRGAVPKTTAKRRTRGARRR